VKIIQDLVNKALVTAQDNVISVYKQAFKFEKPIIKVQVKYRKSTVSAPEVQQIHGANQWMRTAYLFQLVDLPHMQWQK
jgi:predicted Mrr-cat superfamily restriction endonuclease